MRYAMDKICNHCDKGYNDRGRRKFCSRQCYNDSRGILLSDDYVKLWLLGEKTGTYANGAMHHGVRKHLLERSGNRCESPTCCVPGGWSVPNPVTGEPILTIDHIDGDWKNNAVGNLIVLCYNCHTLTPTFGSLNMKSSGVRGSGSRTAPEWSSRNKAARLDTNTGVVLE